MTVLQKMSHNIGMDSTEELIPKYQSRGFQSMWDTIFVYLDLEKIKTNHPESTNC